ncbi:hypothetical protein HHI36_022269, partial [Cryptolaemus montrouzieri]
HLWSYENPRAILKRRSQYKFSVSAWCAFHNNRLIGPHVFNETLNGERFLEFLRNDLHRLMAEGNMRGFIFHHDGQVLITHVQ